MQTDAQFWRETASAACRETERLRAELEPNRQEIERLVLEVKRLRRLANKNESRIEVVGTVGPHVTVCHLAEHSGEFAFVACSEGIALALGRKLKTGEVIRFSNTLEEETDDAECDITITLTARDDDSQREEGRRNLELRLIAEDKTFYTRSEQEYDCVRPDDSHEIQAEVTKLIESVGGKPSVCWVIKHATPKKLQEVHHALLELTKSLVAKGDKLVAERAGQKTVISQEQLSVIERLARDGETHAAIAQAAGCHRQTVATWRKKRKLPGSNWKQPRVALRQIMKLHTEGLGTTAIAAELGVCEATIRKHLNRAGRIWTPAEQQRRHADSVIAANRLLEATDGE